MKDAIQVRELKKNYGSHMVLKGLDFQIEKGEIFALLGVNGAGKTTTLECIEGLRQYDSGAITVNGKMGIQLQSSSLPAHIKPMEAVKLFAKWNKTKIDGAMLDGLGIKEIEKKQYASQPRACIQFEPLPAALQWIEIRIASEVLYSFTRLQRSDKGTSISSFTTSSASIPNLRNSNTTRPAISRV